MVYPEQSKSGFYLCEYTHVLYKKEDKDYVYYSVDDKGCEYNKKVFRSSHSSFKKYFSKTGPTVGKLEIKVKYSSKPLSDHRSSHHDMGKIYLGNTVITTKLNSDIRNHTKSL